MNPNPASLRLRQRILYGKAIAIGPGKAQLLEHIATSGSISAAARQMGMSYRRAWLLVDTMNQCFAAPLIETAAGGSRGGGAKVTPLGEQVLLLYRQIEAKTAAAVADELTELQSFLAPHPPDNPH